MKFRPLKSHMYEKMFGWICPENWFNLIQLLFIPVSIIKNHRSLVSVSSATRQYRLDTQYHKTNHMLSVKSPLTWFQRKENSMCALQIHPSLFLFFLKRGTIKKDGPHSAVIQSQFTAWQSWDLQSQLIFALLFWSLTQCQDLWTVFSNGTNKQGLCVYLEWGEGRRIGE